MEDAATPETYILALDLGTTALKVALFTTRGEVVEHDREPQQVNFLPGGGAEQDPEAWWDGFVRAARRVLDRAAVPPEAVVGVAASSQWSGTVPVDGDGRPASNAIIWMDSRGASEIERIIGGFPKVEGYAAAKLATWIRLTGGAPGKSGKDPIAHILWLKAHRPEAHRAAATFLEPRDWLNLRLSGRVTATFESITLHWVTDTRDIARVDYHPRLLGMAGLDRRTLPDLLPPSSVLGPISEAAAAELGLTDGCKVVSGAPDIMAAAIGSGAVRDFEAHLSVGTSSWLLCHVPFKRTDLFHNMASLPSAIPGRYLLSNEQESAGVCLTALAENILFPGEQPSDLYERMFGMAESVPAGSDGLIFLPWLNGERSPVDDHLIRGGFANLSLQTTRDHLVRAALEGVAFNARWLLTYVEKFIRRRLPGINLIGGGARSDLWCQILADILDRPMRRMADPVLAGARGVALQAAVALGYRSWGDVPDLVPVAKTFEPDPRNRLVYDRHFGEFLNLYRGTKKVAARLNASTKESG